MSGRDATVRQEERAEARFTEKDYLSAIALLVQALELTRSITAPCAGILTDTRRRRRLTPTYSIVPRISSTISTVVSGCRKAKRATVSPCQPVGVTNAIWPASSRSDQAW